MIMNQATKCSNCGSSNMQTGTLHSTGRTYFRPSGAKFLKLQTANIDISADMCLDCGSISLNGDAEKVKNLINNN